MSQNLYLTRYAWKTPLFPNYQPKQDLDIILVIPAFKESQLLSALDSINDCIEPNGSVLILVVVNEAEQGEKEETEINKKCIEQLAGYQSRYELLLAYQKLPTKKAGVGLARKIGMDEAVRFFDKVHKDGIIACYDADCLCEPNYLKEIQYHFSDHHARAGIVFYEHRLDGEYKKEIIQYETYLRYYIDALRYSGYPYAHQTLGSCIIVRSSTYQAQGGMNTRKAGEDFYFLNKVIPVGGFVEINSTTVYPSDRLSDRVPFGTGKAIGQLVEDDRTYSVYNPKSFEDLKVFFSQTTTFWNNERFELPGSIEQFLDDKVKSEIDGIRKQTTSFPSFQKRFFHWFDAFKILKYIHFARDHWYENVHLKEAMHWLGNEHKGIVSDDEETQLKNLRFHDRKGLTINQTDPSPL